MAYSEYISTQGLRSGDTELSLFRSADNLPIDTLLVVACDYIDKVPSAAIKQFNTGELVSADRPERLKPFEINLTVVKKAILIKEEGLSAFEALCDWMFYSYISTLSSLLFFAI